MTDERKAMFEDWKNKNKEKIEGVVITLLSYEKGVDTKTCYDEVDWIIKKAYLAGLKAGRPEWHKVADGDLPLTSGEMHAERYPILACTKNGYVTAAIRRKHGRAYEWFCSDYDGNTLYLDKEIIAWCEIPSYRLKQSNF